MILGSSIQPVFILIGGVSLFALLVFQMLVGLRKIKFKGPKHSRVHRLTGWILVAMSLFHAFGATVYVMGWKIG